MNEEYETDWISLKDLCKAVCQRWILMLLCAVLAAAAVAGGSFLKGSGTETSLPEENFTASALVSVNISLGSDAPADSETRTGAAAAGTIVDQISALAKLETYCRLLLTQDQVLEDVASQCGTDTDFVQDSVSVAVIADTNLLKITVTTDDSQLSKRICGMLAYKAQDILMPALDAESVQVISGAKLEESASDSVSAVSKSSPKKGLLAAVAGLILSCVYIVLDYLLNPKVRTEGDVQRRLGLKLLGTVPGGKEKRTNG